MEVAQEVFLEEEGPEWSLEGPQGCLEREMGVGESILQEAPPPSQPHPVHCPGHAQSASLAWQGPLRQSLGSAAKALPPPLQAPVC